MAWLVVCWWFVEVIVIRVREPGEVEWVYEAR
jgi:hypothetical protein